MSDIPINLVFEDALSGSVLRKLVGSSHRRYLIGENYSTGGFGGIKKNINGYNHAAKGMPYLVLTDLDKCECPPILIKQWFSTQRHPNLLFRVAVRQVEAWLLACRGAFARFLGIDESLIPTDVDGIQNSKEFVVNLARRSRKKEIRLDIVPEQGSTAKVGPDYNGRLVYFVERLWDPDEAKNRSESLRRTVAALDTFEPVFESHP